MMVVCFLCWSLFRVSVLINGVSGISCCCVVGWCCFLRCVWWCGMFMSGWLFIVILSW